MTKDLNPTQLSGFREHTACVRTLLWHPDPSPRGSRGPRPSSSLPHRAGCAAVISQSRSSPPLRARGSFLFSPLYLRGLPDRSPSTQKPAFPSYRAVLLLAASPHSSRKTAHLAWRPACVSGLRVHLRPLLACSDFGLSCCSCTYTHTTCPYHVSGCLLSTYEGQVKCHRAQQTSVPQIWCKSSFFKLLSVCDAI